jgi:hypothetical protein
MTTSIIDVGQITGSQIVFRVLGQTGPATYNYPFTFS